MALMRGRRRCNRPSHYICKRNVAVLMLRSSQAPVPRRSFGRYSDQIAITGHGGYPLGKPKTVSETVRMLHAAIDAGVNFLDNAWDYHEGESEKRVGRAIADRREDVFLMTKACTHGRSATVAMRQLDES